MKKAITTFKLHEWELKALCAPIGAGGHQGFHREIMERLQEDGTISFTDEQLGKLVRHMGYGSGGFQSRLRKAFASHLVRLIGCA
jgi:hypothetical protein